MCYEVYPPFEAVVSAGGRLLAEWRPSSVLFHCYSTRGPLACVFVSVCMYVMHSLLYFRNASEWQQLRLHVCMCLCLVPSYGISSFCFSSSSRRGGGLWWLFLHPGSASFAELVMAVGCGGSSCGSCTLFLLWSTKHAVCAVLC